jgi:tRNA(adenine34) deaminase
MSINDEYFMGLALEEAQSAYEEGEVPVGALLVTEQKIIARTHNKSESTHDATAHAELLAIREGAAVSGDWRLTDTTLYVTKEPCVMCAGALLNARVGRLVYGCRDERFGAVNSRYQLLHDPLLKHQVRVVTRVLEAECAEILKKFFKMRRK